MGAHSLTGGLLSSGLGSRREMQIQVEDPSLSGTGRGLWLEPMVLSSSPSQTVKGSRSELAEPSKQSGSSFTSSATRRPLAVLCPRQEDGTNWPPFHLPSRQR